MKRITLISIFLVCLMNIVHCRKYLVEVDDDNMKPSRDNEDVRGDPAEEEDERGSRYIIKSKIDWF